MYAWQKFRILNRTQVFMVASVCAAAIALAIALASIPADGTSWNRFLGPSRQLDPFVNFGSAFVAVLPIFLGYYHLARLGAFLGLGVSALAAFLTQVCAGLVFEFRVVGPSVVSLGDFKLERVTVLRTCSAKQSLTRTDAFCPPINQPAQ
jgi:hypothetical protein